MREQIYTRNIQVFVPTYRSLLFIIPVIWGLSVLMNSFIKRRAKGTKLLLALFCVMFFLSSEIINDLQLENLLDPKNVMCWTVVSQEILKTII